MSQSQDFENEIFFLYTQTKKIGNEEISIERIEILRIQNS